MSDFRPIAWHKCRLLAVLCGNYVGVQRDESGSGPKYQFPQIQSAGQLEVGKLVNPTLDQFREKYKSFYPHFLYFQGEQLENEETIGSLIWGGRDVLDSELLGSLVSPPLPTVVYLEVQKSAEIALALRSKGIPHVIYWNATFTSYASAQFRHALFSVVQSSLCHISDSFQLAFASCCLHCIFGDYNHRNGSSQTWPSLLGDVPSINMPTPVIPFPEPEMNTSGILPKIQIHDTDVNARFLVCGTVRPLDAFVLGSLEDGLNALLNIEIRGGFLRCHNVSAMSPVPKPGSVAGVLMVDCYFTTSSSVYFWVPVSCSPETYSNASVLESCIKKELVENRYPLIRPLPDYGEKDPEAWSSAAIAGGACNFQVSMTVPSWAAQVFEQLANQLRYRSLVALGISAVEGCPVASFDREDADRLLFFCTKQEEKSPIPEVILRPPAWTAPLTQKPKKGVNIAVLRPIPRIWRPLGLPFSVDGNQVSDMLSSSEHSVFPESLYCQSMLKKDNRADGNQVSDMLSSSDCSILPEAPCHQSMLKKNKSVASSLLEDGDCLQSSSRERVKRIRAEQNSSGIPFLNKHGCSRSPIRTCSEEEFLNDVFHHIKLQGHRRLVQGEISQFPNAILNGKQLDLFNLYKEVVFRGGFDVSDGINWRGQIFPKMKNYMENHKMTNISDALKKHYRRYLWEYELAHDDVEEWRCLLCESTTEGEWVNCDLCKEWAHYHCDRRQDLASFKEYAKTNGPEYVCPRCSAMEG